jgi:gamma-glutamyl-gamma-aminobutyrate hydrolase PuuD
LGFIHHKVGDEKTFFELLLPRKAAKQAVPVLGIIAGIGIALLLLRSL